MSLIGYAWCLGKAVPVYNDAGLVNDPEYARFYFSELPSFSAADYPYITIMSKYRLLRFTEEDYLSIMSKGAFETVDNFPFLSLLNRTDSPGTAPYGYNWIDGADIQAYAICALTNTSPGPDGAEYFDTYLTGSTGVSGLYRDTISNAIRFDGQENFTEYTRVHAPIICHRNGTKLTINNIGDYLVLTETNKRNGQSNPFCLRSWLTGFALGLAGKSLPYGKVTRKPTAYLYNDNRLPALPEWDKEKYPYAVIYSVFGVALHVFPQNADYFKDYCWSFGFDEYKEGEVGLYWALTETEEGLQWTFSGSGANVIVDDGLIWTNFDILNEDSSVYLAASEPVPVYE